MKFYLGGFTWDNVSQLDRFLEEGIWENGWGADGEYQNTFDTIEKGDLIALKSTYRQGGKSWLRIYNIGIVRDVYSETILRIEWQEDFEQQNYTDIGWYAHTLLPITSEEHINRVFGQTMLEFKEIKMKRLTTLLKAKHQVILQGAPGTGKTYLAKKLAKEIVLEQKMQTSTPKDIDESDILELLKIGLSLPSVSKRTTYTIEAIDSRKITVSGYTMDEDKEVPLNNIIEAYRSKKWLPGKIINGLDSYDAALAFYIYNNMNRSLCEFIKLVQFHPSYTYEDFVRGIVVSTVNGNTPQYLTVNKVFGELAAKAEAHTELNYVLIIDEINRANLPAVLGELIYALEYRGEAMETMYKLEDGRTDLIIPPNLYIIGTMNTADRSVGQIDYAIRRRFAFVDIEAEDLSAELGDKFNVDFFYKVQNLFTEEFLSSEFEKRDVQLGHSYFIVDDKNTIDLRLEYEIKPILREYVRDGILKENAKLVIEGLNP